MKIKNILRTTIFILLFIFCIINHAVSQVRIITIGDSTMAQYDEQKYSCRNEQRGWAQLFPAFLKSNAEVYNWGKAGRSSKSFYYEYWKRVRETIQPGDYLIVQFGHNDEKAEGLDSEGRNKDSKGTAAWGQYQEYLTKYVEEGRKLGAIPVLMTSVVRAEMDENGKLRPSSLHNLTEVCGNDSLMNYPLAMRSLAKKLNVSLIDMTVLTEKLVEEYGYDKAKQLIYCNKDNTHLKATGALIFAGLVADELAKQNILTDYLLPF